MNKLILAIEDDLHISKLYQELLTEAGYEVQLMTSKPADIQIIAQMQPALVISDWGLNHEDFNWNFINAMHVTPNTASIPIMVCTALPVKSKDISIRLTKLNIEVLEKPFDIDDLLQIVEKKLSDSLSGS